MIDTFLTILFFSLAAVNIAMLAGFLIPDKTRKTRFSPPLSVVIPAHNEEKYIAGTIKSVIKSKYANKLDVIVVDDGSTDSTSSIVGSLSRENKNLRLLKIRHSGKSIALNYGIRKAKFNIVAYIDADSSLAENSLSKLVMPLENEDIVISSGVIRARQTRNPLTWFQDIEYIVSSGWRYVCSKFNATYIAPGFAAFRKDAVLRAGGFSSDTLTEDIDTTITLRKAGHGAVMSSAVMFTSVPSTLKGLVKQRIRWGRGTIQTAKKHTDIIFSQKFKAVGMYGFPIHMFWYVFAFLYMPFAFYWAASAYLNLPSAMPLDTLIFLLRWFTVYGIFDLLYNVIVGSYALTPLIFSILLSWAASFAYLLMSMKKLSAFNWKFLSYVLMFPYHWLMFTVQGFVFVYETLIRSSGNIWNKVDGNSV